MKPLATIICMAGLSASGAAAQNANDLMSAECSALILSQRSPELMAPVAAAFYAGIVSGAGMYSRLSGKAFITAYSEECRANPGASIQATMNTLAGKLVSERD